MNDLRTFCAAYESSVPKVGLTSYAGSGAEAAAVGGGATEHIQACADDDISVAGAANMRQHGRNNPPGGINCGQWARKHAGGRNNCPDKGAPQMWLYRPFQGGVQKQMQNR